MLNWLKHVVEYTTSLTTKSFVTDKLLYILESNPHPFHSFRGLKNQMQIRFACRLDSRSRTGFWKNDRAAVSAITTIQYSNLLFIRFTVIAHNLIVICALHPVTIIFIFNIVLPYNDIFRSVQSIAYATAPFGA
jgi:hypothetical protein